MIAITGATGFIGREVVRQALAAGLPVRAIVRDPRTAKLPAEVELFHGNVLYAPSLEGAFQGCRAVIHLVGIISEWRENTFQRAHVVATQNVLDAAKRAGVKRWIQMSALGTRADARTEYHRTKWAAEEAVRKSGLAWTILRPSLVYGEGDRGLNRLAMVVRWMPVVPVLGSGQARIQPVAVEQVAHCFVRAIWTDAAVQRMYDLCGPVALTWNELYDELMRALGVRKPKGRVPVRLAYAVGAILERTGPYPMLSRQQVLLSQEDNCGDPVPAMKDFVFEQEPLTDYL
ncbi:MAG: complex I NDUFA9 subunit family protein, partial [Verrucomicrobiae bacterium]|nr:complex I NDUFA9 subunit family protein [Verrucomicrobiae bacterium]